LSAGEQEKRDNKERQNSIDLLHLLNTDSQKGTTQPQLHQSLLSNLVPKSKKEERKKTLEQEPGIDERENQGGKKQTTPARKGLTRKGP